MSLEHLLEAYDDMRRGGKLNMHFSEKEEHTIKEILILLANQIWVEAYQKGWNDRELP
jgi:hypothetical protein